MKSIWTMLAAVISINMAGVSVVVAGAIDYPDLNVAQGFASHGAGETSFGYVTGLRIGSTDLVPDIAVKNPISKETMKVVGVMSAYGWSSELAAPMKLAFSVSQANKEILKGLQKDPLAKKPVEFNFQIFAFDPGSKQHYIALKSFTFPYRGIMNRIGSEMPSMKLASFPLRGNLENVAGKRQMTVDDARNMAVANPPNYLVRISVTPSVAKQQDVIYATSPGKATKLPWGTKEN